MSVEFKLSLNSSHFQPFAFWFAKEEKVKVLDNANSSWEVIPNC